VKARGEQARQTNNIIGGTKNGGGDYFREMALGFSLCIQTISFYAEILFIVLLAFFFPTIVISACCVCSGLID